MRALIHLATADLRDQGVIDRGGRQFVHAMHTVSNRVVELTREPLPGGPVHRGYVPPPRP